MADAAPTPSPLAHEVAVMRQRIADLEAALAAQQALVQALGARQAGTHSSCSIPTSGCSPPIPPSTARFR
jgi:hypothetical protein